MGTFQGKVRRKKELHFSRVLYMRVKPHPQSRRDARRSGKNQKLRKENYNLLPDFAFLLVGTKNEDSGEWQREECDSWNVGYIPCQFILTGTTIVTKGNSY